MMEELVKKLRSPTLHFDHEGNAIAQSGPSREEREAADLLEAQAALIAEAKELTDWFCGRVENGEFRSKKTYARFKAFRAKLDNA